MKDKNIPHSIKVLSQENDIMTLLVDNRKFFIKIYKANAKYYAIIMKNTKCSEICSIITEDKLLILFDSIVDFFINGFQLALSKSYEEYLFTKILADKLKKNSTCNIVNQNSNNINTDSNDKYIKDQEEYKNQKYENHNKDENNNFEKNLKECLTHDDSLFPKNYSSHICENCQFCFNFNDNLYCQGLNDSLIKTKPKFGCAYFIKKKEENL